MDKKAVVYIHNGVLLSHYKEYIWISSNEVDETGAYYTEWSKSAFIFKFPIIFFCMSHIDNIFLESCAFNLILKNFCHWVDKFNPFIRITVILGHVNNFNISFHIFHLLYLPFY